MYLLRHHSFRLLRIPVVHILMVVCSWGVIACSSLTPETNVPEHQRRVIHALKIMEQQQKAQIQLTDLLHFPAFQPIDQLAVGNPDFLRQCAENFNQDSLGDAAALASFHAETGLFALRDETTGETRIYRQHQDQAVELGLLYAGVEDMQLRFRQKGLQEDATLQEAIAQGMFDLGSVFMAVPDKKAGKSDY